MTTHVQPCPICSQQASFVFVVKTNGRSISRSCMGELFIDEQAEIELSKMAPSVKAELLSFAIKQRPAKKAILVLRHPRQCEAMHRTVNTGLSSTKVMCMWVLQPEE